jgi:hypothetical protein
MSHLTRSFGIITIVVLVSTTQVGRAAPADPTSRITAAANVTLRAMPSPEAAAIAQVPLGTEVTDAGPAGLDKTWVRVKLADGREGWLQASLTRVLDPSWRWTAFDRIIAERLGRKGDGFPALAELVAFIERVGPEYTNPEGRAQLEFSRLRAIGMAAAAIPRGTTAREPYASWIATHQNEVLYDSPTSKWILAAQAVWDAHKRHAESSVSDELAWFAVTTGVVGECAGRLTCYLDVRDRLYGEYLRRRPFGKHAAEAVDVIRNTADALAPRDNAAGTYAFDRGRDCKSVNDLVDALTSAVQTTRTESRDAAKSSLAAVKKICGT